MQMRKIKIGKHSKNPNGILSTVLIKLDAPFGHWLLFLVEMRWGDRLYLCFHQFSNVGTTIRKKEALPVDLSADEHHIKVRGKKSYVATTYSKYR